MRRLGSAAIDLCYVAAGRMDGFWESDLKPWDIAGGALIVARGRRTRDAAWTASPFTSRAGQVLATNGLLHEPMLEVIRDFERGRLRADAAERHQRTVRAIPPRFPADFPRFRWHRSCY